MTTASPSKTQICRNAILPDTQPPCHPSSKGWKTIERTAPIGDTQEVQSSAGSSFGKFFSEYSISNQFSLEHERSAFHQFKTPGLKLGISYGNVTKSPDYLKADWKLHSTGMLQQVLKPQKINFDKRVQKVGSFPVQVAFGPSQLNVYRKGCKMEP